jgi:hypothetical protein
MRSSTAIVDSAISILDQHIYMPTTKTLDGVYDMSVMLLNWSERVFTEQVKYSEC